MGTRPIVRAPASSANLGPGFDVLGMALDLAADVGTGPPPAGGRRADENHPARVAFEALGGSGELWVRSNIPMGRGLGFSGAVRVAGAGLAAVLAGGGRRGALTEAADDVLGAAAALEGHADNAAASLFGGIVAWVEDRPVPLRVGPRLGSERVIAWIPDAVTSTERSRRSLPETVSRESAVHNLGRVAQLVAAIERDEPALLPGSTSDRLHQEERLAAIPSAQEALDRGVAAGAWCGWLSGSGPTIALLVDADRESAVVDALPAGGQIEQLRIDRVGARLVES